ncbi:hypothetical protein ACFWNK_38495, partial [Streptomyces sp. NPDC058417]|uniref:hypothetical protein n=1 Tax=unclassified Streptomyces TaxID=2593676 RepID=UPI003658F571
MTNGDGAAERYDDPGLEFLDHPPDRAYHEVHLAGGRSISGSDPGMVGDLALDGARPQAVNRPVPYCDRFRSKGPPARRQVRGHAFSGQASDRLCHAAIRNFSYSAWTSRGG